MAAKIALLKDVKSSIQEVTIVELIYIYLPQFIFSNIYNFKIKITKNKSITLDRLSDEKLIITLVLEKMQLVKSRTKIVFKLLLYNVIAVIALKELSLIVL